MKPLFDINISDFEYRNIGTKALLARIYRPIGIGPFPAIIEVHGGAWTSNDRTTNTPIHKELSKSGVVVMAIDFRMPPIFKYPDSLKDINFAVRWLRNNAHRFDIEPLSIGLLGTSSGGHQAILNALSPNKPEFSDADYEFKKIDPSVQYVIGCWSVLDPVARYEMVVGRGIQRLVDAHHAFWPTMASMTEGSPQKIIEAKSQEKIPSLLLLQGTEDDNLPPGMAERFFESYKHIGGKVVLEKFTQQPHAFIGKDPTSNASLKALKIIKQFIHKEAESTN